MDRLIAAARLPPKGRDYRLDLLRGFAIWAIFLDHIPDNAVSLMTVLAYYRSWSKDVDKLHAKASASTAPAQPPAARAAETPLLSSSIRPEAFKVTRDRDGGEHR
jgi:hypothetical protein